MIKIIFSHGKESGPEGSKILQMRETAHRAGFETLSIDYRGLNSPEERTEHLLTCVAGENLTEPPILVGSSMGAYVSLAASRRLSLSGLFLLASAVYVPGYELEDLPPPSYPITLIHGLHDEIIPFGHALRFAQKHNCSLHLLPDDHRLSSSIEEIKHLLIFFLTQTKR